MEDKTKIDELFKQGLGGFTAEPPADTWQNIQDNLMTARRRKRMAFWRISGTAAALVLAFFSGYYFDMSTRSLKSGNKELNPSGQFSTQGSSSQWNTETVEKSVSDIQNQRENDKPSKNADVIPKTKNTLNLPRTTKRSINTLVIADGEKRNSPDTQEGSLAFSQTTSSKSLELDSTKVKTEELAINGENQPNNDPTAYKDPATVNQNSQTPAIAETQTKDEVETKDNVGLQVDDEPFVYDDGQSSKKKKRYATRGAFDLGAVGSPTFAFLDVNPQPTQQTSVNTNLGTASDKKQSDNLKNSYAAGLNLSYRTGARWEISTGLHINNWNQFSSDVFLTADAYGSITTSGLTARGNISTGAITYSSGNTVFDATKFENVGPNEYYLIPDIQQQYQFLEVPLRLGYYIFDSQKWSFKVQAGLSGRFLTHSDVKFVFEDGHTENYDGLEIKNFSLQLIGGTGLGYKATKNLSINLTPSIQYGVTPVNKNSEIETYFHQFLVYTGLTYSF